MDDALQIQLKYSGADSDSGLISLYDLSQSLYGFERSLALTTHLILNGEVITQATALRGAQIFCHPPEKGSFSVLASVALVAGGAYKLTTLRKDNPLGHLVHSTYDYMVHKVTGQSVDYDRSLRDLYHKSNAERDFGLIPPRESQLDSLAEKIEPPLTRMHRPIVRSETAESAKILFLNSEFRVDNDITFDRRSYARMKYRDRLEDIEVIDAKVSVFNPNTYNGRLFVPKLERTVPFYLTHAGRSSQAFRLIGDSYNRNLNDRNDSGSLLQFDVFKTFSKLGRLTKLSVVRVSDVDEDDSVICYNDSDEN